MTEAEEQEVQLTLMEQGDVPAVHALEVQCFPTPWEITAYYRDIRNPAAHYEVAKVGDTVVGFAGMWVVGDEAHIVTIAVSPGHRRLGIGRKLMVRMMAEARQRGAAAITLEVRVSNAAAQHLYESLGFSTIAHRRRYYPDNREDAAVMYAEI